MVDVVETSSAGFPRRNDLNPSGNDLGIPPVTSTLLSGSAPTHAAVDAEGLRPVILAPRFQISLASKVARCRSMPLAVTRR